MRIKITQKLRPFSHLPGTCCLIPYTTWEAKIFPAKIFFRNLASEERKEVDIDVKGPVKDFTILQDLERGRVEVFGKGPQGYFRYFLCQETYPFLKKQDIPPSRTRLSLGVHKKQDWDLVKRREDMGEIFPFWLRLSQIVPEYPLPQVPIGTDKLLLEGNLALTFKATFQGILSPRLKDENYLGLIPDIQVPKGLCPLGILHQGAKQITALFFKEEKNHWFFLPWLPKEFHAGRFLCLQTELGDEIDLEWSKKELKKVIIRSATSRVIFLALQKKIKSFRVRTHLNQRGERSAKEIALEKGKIFYLDRFMH